jgi:uncharacterized DUF497 family protein
MKRVRHQAGAYADLRADSQGRLRSLSPGIEPGGHAGIRRGMEIEFDPTKDALNVAKHEISLARAAETDIHAQILDARYEEPRYRLYGLIDGPWYCAAATDRGNSVRIISLRRAHAEEVEAYVESR